MKELEKKCQQCGDSFHTTDEDEEYCSCCRTRVYLGVFDGKGGMTKKPKSGVCL